MHRLLIACMAALAFLIASPAYAQWYVSVHTGAVWLQDSDLDDTFAGGSATGEADFDSGWMFGATVGRTFSGGFRVEGEVSYRQNDIDSVTIDSFTIGPTVFTGIGTFSVDGEVDSVALMANVWKDFTTGSWKPYIGGGIGAVGVGIDVDSIGGVGVSYDDEDWVFGYQLGAGVGFQVAPSTIVSVDYRFLGTSDPEFEDSGEKLEAEYQSHSVMVGLRFQL